MAQKYRATRTLVVLGVALCLATITTPARAQGEPHCNPDVGEINPSALDATPQPKATARLTIKTPEVKGPLDKKVVNRVVRRQKEVLLECYEQSLETNPDLDGEVVLRLMVGPRGDVMAVVFSVDTTEAPALRACVTSATRRWHFPRSTGSAAEVFAPLHFHRETSPSVTLDTPVSHIHQDLDLGTRRRKFEDLLEDVAVDDHWGRGVATPMAGAMGASGYIGGVRCQPEETKAEEGAATVVVGGNPKDAKTSNTEDEQRNASKSYVKVPATPSASVVSMDTRAIRAVILEHRRELEVCFKEAQERDGEGVFRAIDLSFTIGTGGKVTRVSARRGDEKLESLEACMLEKMSAWKFPEPPGGVVVVRYPLTTDPIP